MNDHAAPSPDEFTHRRRLLVEKLRKRKAFDDAVLDAMLEVPREAFVDAEYRAFAYEDNALPISHGQTISQPTIVALMTTELQVTPDCEVLEIGTGSGYHAAVLAQLVRSVVSIEIHPELVQRAERVLGSLGIENVQVITGDGSKGWPPSAPYDRILITAAAPSIPDALLDQLRPREGSCIVVPVGDQESQQLVRVEWTESGWRRRNVGTVRFVPLRGAEGWSESEWSNRRLRIPDE